MLHYADVLLDNGPLVEGGTLGGINSVCSGGGGASRQGSVVGKSERDESRDVQQIKCLNDSL